MRNTDAAPVLSRSEIAALARVEREAGKTGEELFASSIIGDRKKNGTIDRRGVTTDSANRYDVVRREAGLMGLTDGRRGEHVCPAQRNSRILQRHSVP